MSTPWILKMTILAPTKSKLELTQQISEKAKNAILGILESDYKEMEKQSNNGVKNEANTTPTTQNT